MSECILEGKMSRCSRCTHLVVCCPALLLHLLADTHGKVPEALAAICRRIFLFWLLGFSAKWDGEGAGEKQGSTCENGVGLDTSRCGTAFARAQCPRRINGKQRIKSNAADSRTIHEPRVAESGIAKWSRSQTTISWCGENQKISDESALFFSFSQIGQKSQAAAGRMGDRAPAMPLTHTSLS